MSTTTTTAMTSSNAIDKYPEKSMATAMQSDDDGDEEMGTFAMPSTAAATTITRRRRRIRSASLYGNARSLGSSSFDEEGEEDDDEDEEEYDGEFQMDLDDGEDDIVVAPKAKTSRGRANSAPSKSDATNKRQRSTVRTKTGAWTEEEDETLRRLVEEYGAQKWSTISRSLPGRIGKQARERWFNHLSPDINKAWWSEAEERFIIEFHDLYGNLWSQLSRMLNNGRPANAIKNHWNSTLKRAVEKGKSSAKSGDSHYFVELPACPTKRETGRGSTKATGTGQYIKIKFRKAGDPIDDRLKIPDDEEVSANNLSPRSNMSISPRSTRSRASSRTSRYSTSSIGRRSSSLDENVKPMAMEAEDVTASPSPSVLSKDEAKDVAMTGENDSFMISDDDELAATSSNTYTVTPLVQLQKGAVNHQRQGAEPGSFPNVPRLQFQQLHQPQQQPLYHASSSHWHSQQQQQHPPPQQPQRQQQQHDKYREVVLQRQRQAALERMALNYNESISCWNNIARMQDHHNEHHQQLQQQLQPDQLFSNDQAMDPLFDVGATIPFTNGSSDHHSYHHHQQHPAFY